MTDVDLVRRKLAIIEGCVADLRSLAKLGELERDVRERRFVEHTLQIGIQAAIDVALHVIADERLGEPDTNRAAFDLLHRHGWIPEPTRVVLSRLAGFRNLLVHGYAVVDPAIVREIASQRVADLLGFVAAIRARLA